MFKLYDCDVVMTVEGVNYNFNDVNSIEIEDPEITSLTRGANGKNQEGIPFKEGVRDPKIWTMPVMNIPIELKAVLDDVYEKTKRVDLNCVSRSTGARKSIINAVLRQKPQQLTVDETADSLAVSLAFAGYANKEVYK